MRLTFAIIIIIGFMNVGLSKGGMGWLWLLFTLRIPFAMAFCYVISNPPLALGFKAKVTTRRFALASKMKLHEVIWMTMWEQTCLLQAKGSSRRLNLSIKTSNTQQHHEMTPFLYACKNGQFENDVKWLKIIFLLNYIRNDLK